MEMIMEMSCDIAIAQAANAAERSADLILETKSSLYSEFLYRRSNHPTFGSPSVFKFSRINENL